MISIEYLEQQKTEIVADHIRRCHDIKLSEAEKMMIAELNWQISQLKEMMGERTGGN